uniref:Uncharacterized protein n=1 Tax=Myoviridae sp. ctRPH1 TaxID=2826650 RepID=A0A8S5MAF6_9CAUD|nr:MAG TPA: hypothetical protein [Myoviridae sp. ctRPH1]
MLEIKIVLEAAELSAAMQRLAEALEGRGIPAPQPPQEPNPKGTAPAQTAPTTGTAAPTPAPDPAPATAAPTAPAADDAAPSAEVSVEDIRSKFIALSAAGLKKPAREIVSKYADKLSNIPADKYAEVLAELKKLEVKKAE